MDYKLITKCRACLHEITGNEKDIFSFGNVPLAGSFRTTSESALSAAKYPLELVCCNHCQTVQVMHDVDDKVLFSEYNYTSSSVGGLNSHFLKYAYFLTGLYKDKSILTFLEIGCNDGVLLKKLPEQWKKIGVDPSDIAKKYADGSYDLINAPFSKELVESKNLVEKCDVISGSNCLAHISGIRNVFEGIWLALKENGDFFIEVHDLHATISGNQWETIYHEHKIEWDIESLCNVLIPLGFSYEAIEYLPLHGGLIRAKFKKSKVRGTITAVSNDKKIELLKGLHKAFESRYDNDVVKLLLKQDPSRIIAYGAAGRAVMFLNHMNELNFKWIIDDSEIRIGKFIPTVATHIISSEKLKEEQYDFCLVTAWNYFDDIISKNNFYKGTWLKYF